MTIVWKGAGGLAIAAIAGAATPTVDLTLSIENLRRSAAR